MKLLRILVFLSLIDKILHKIILIIAFILISFCFSETEPDLSNRIIIDGISNDFTFDENILIDSLGILLESPSDSYWGEYNDVKQIKITWDESYLYLAVDACSWGNNVMLFIDIYEDYGIEDMSELNAWQRSFNFYNCNPDFFVGTWDTNEIPQFWKVQEGSSMQVEQISTTETYSTFDTSNLAGAMEIKIAWEILFYDQEHSLQHFPSIKLLSVITGGNDYSSGPDCAPDNLEGMTNNASQMILLDNYAEILIDADHDGNPDMNISPQDQTDFPILIPGMGCTNPEACNYDDTATAEDGSCIYSYIGDLNSDCEINVADVITIVTLILQEESITDQDLLISDMNDDSVINVIDILILVDIILN